MRPMAVPNHPDRPTVDGVYVAHVERIFILLREKLPRVLAANRYFEEQTRLHNEAGRNNLVDALSHLATLIEQAGSLDFEAQAEQVTLLEDHLRRSMMEAFEQVVKLRLGQAAELWETYSSRRGARVWAEDLDAPTEAEVDRARRRVQSLLERGRAAKRDVSWRAWEEGTQYLVEACKVVVDLEGKLRRALARAEYERRQGRARTYFVALAASTTMLVVGVLIGLLLGH